MRWIIIISIYVLLMVYSFQAIKTAVRMQWVSWTFLALAILVLANLVFQFFMSSEGGRVLTGAKSYAMGFMLAMMLFMIVNVVFLLPEDLVRLTYASGKKMFVKNAGFTIPERRRFISTMALALAALPFGAILYGMYKGKYNYKVLKYDLVFDDLPDAFHGYKITQISDIHSGSFDNGEKIAYGVDLINQQKSDVILFTGDMVNNQASEMEPWAPLFSTLKAPDGKFSVLGNHDYGDYYDWGTEKEKERNLERLKEIQKEMGFDLLLNENRYLTKKGQKLALIGVENWGNGFKQVGDLQKAKEGIHQDDFKILMSHDPSHWDAEVVHDDHHFHLTLSGHTHGMQFGIEIPGWIKWSPVKWRYKHWAGIYEQKGQYINVNRGFGFLAYPGRVGIWPEITVITMKKKSLT